MQTYSIPSRAADPFALPDVEIFERTAEECALDDEDLVAHYLREFPLAGISSRERARMIAEMIRREGIEGGWFYWICFPGCLPDSPAIGPFESWRAAQRAAQEAERAEEEPSQ